jgi:hypothetical protein
MTGKKPGKALDPALNVPCPTCYVRAGEPCRSRHAIPMHKSRREALADLSAQAGQILAANRPEPVRRPSNTATATSPGSVVMGRTGAENIIPETVEYWPPWEHPPVPGCLAESGITVSGLVWCAVHKEYEELRDGIPGVRAAGWQ